MGAERAGDLWLRLRWQPRRLRAELRDVPREMLLKGLLKAVGRRIGFGVEEVVEVTGGDGKRE